MKELPAFRNVDVCSFVIDLTCDCVKSYQVDVACDIKCLYQNILCGGDSMYWGVRDCGTGMGYTEDSEILNYYKKSKMIVLFKFSNLHFVDGNIRGDVAMISYTEPYKNKWYNAIGTEANWYHAEDDFDEFYNEVRTIAQKFLKDKE